MDKQNGLRDSPQDDCSIKPVSSLRSHFEQMMTTTTTTVLPSNHATVNSRPVSPRPKPPLLKAKPVTLTSNGLSKDALDSNPATINHRSGPIIPPRPRPISIAAAPAVTIDPPTSPAKVGDTLQAVTLVSDELTIEPPLTPGPTLLSPKTPRAINPPQSPRPDAQGARATLTIQPPEPPPPRRSGEMRRVSSLQVGTNQPPQINRGDKPTTINRRLSPIRPAETQTLETQRRVSPFNSPPSSVDGSPDRETEVRTPPRGEESTSVTPRETSRGHAVHLNFETPPVHHSITARRREQEVCGLSPQSTGDMPHFKPALPSRHASVLTKFSRQSMDGAHPNPAALGSSTAHQSSHDGHGIARHSTISSHDIRAKRISSNPLTQLPPSPRHNRSATVDQSSNRNPSNIRIQPPVRSKETLLQRSASVATDSDTTKQTLYPDPSKSNRRPPQHKHGAVEIQLRSDARIFDVCGEYICASGLMTRVWSIRTGEQVFSCAHPEGIIIKSIAFKPACEIAEEGCRIWLGNNFGELVEVDLTTGVTIGKVNAHARHEVIKIYRHNLELWTLDDVGTLHVWPSCDSGAPSLHNMSHSHRVPKGHSFSMVVDDELWHAIGKELRIFVPTPDGAAQFQVLQRPISQAGVGDITAGTVLSGQRDRVYIGHNDGKVSIYAKENYTCLGVVNVNMFRINTMSGEGDYLWTGYNTGMIYVYDTTQTPWVVKKDWRAHDNPVTCLLNDRAGFWRMNRSQIISYGVDSRLGIWDGMLQEDWLELQMQENDTNYCQFEKIKALVVTWNAGASTPSNLRYDEQDASFLKDLLQGGDAPDMLIFGFQELVDLEDKKTTAKSFFKSKRKDSTGQDHMSHQYREWKDHLQRSLDENLPQEEVYHMLHSANLVGLFTCIFIKSRFKNRIKGVCSAEVKRGMGGLHGNKGALLVRFMLADTSLCFINCHLAAGQTSTKERNYDITEILENRVFPNERDPGSCVDKFTGGGDGSMIMDHEICILNGDLNYRIDTMSRDAVVSAIKAGNLSKLLERDQLLVTRRKNPTFRLRAFQELPITFDPTYKYDVGTDRYDTSEKRRAPAWCDRILFRSRDSTRVKQLDYRRHEVKVSDHRPVSGRFSITIKTISPAERASTWQDCLQRLDELKVEWALVSMTEYLTVTCGYELNSALRMIKDNYKGRRS